MKKNLVLIMSFMLYFFCPPVFSQNSYDISLLEAIKKNDFPKVKALVEHGANVSTFDTNNASAIMWATYKSDLEMVSTW
jgi:ankyrin repeat protein